VTITYERAMTPGAVPADEWLAHAAGQPDGCPAVMPVSGKGGVGKTWMQLQIAAEASRLGIPVLMVDIDPEGNLSYRQGVLGQHGVGEVLADAGALTGDPDALDPVAGAKRLNEVIRPGTYPGVDVVSCGPSLNGIGQVNIPNLMLLRAIFVEADIYSRYGLILIDTPGRTGHLTSLAMYAASCCYGIVTNTKDSIRKVVEARRRVSAVQGSHPLRWAGTVLTNFGRDGTQDALHTMALDTLGDDARIELPPRSILRETFELAETGERLGDRRGALPQNLARAERSFLLRDVFQLDGAPGGILR
jgi:chromosome partitioning protein